MTPRLEIYPARITENTAAVLDQCRRAGVEAVCVTKGVCAHPAVVKAMIAGGARLFADSRLEDIEKLRRSGVKGPFLLLRLPTKSRALETVKCAEISLNSSLETIKELSKAAVSVNKIHSIFIMIDVGDLREGVWPDKASALVCEAMKLPNIKILGLGCNLACYGGVIPSKENMKLLVDTAEQCRKASGLELAVLSGGNSSGLPLLAAGGLPEGINHYRIGESILLGRSVIDRSPWQGTRQDTFKAVAEVIESEYKPSVPVGVRGENAFNTMEEYADNGIRHRVICNIGRQDAAVNALTPLEDSIRILGASSDHLLLDVHDAKRDIQVGDEIAFYPGYSALLALFTSEYVQKVVIEE